MPQTCCFLTSFFSRFGLDFGVSWASKMEPSRLKIEKNLVWVWSGCALGYLLKLDVLKNGVLEGSGLDFGAPGLDFGDPGPRFWRPWGTKCYPRATQEPTKPARNNLASQTAEGHPKKQSEERRDMPRTCRDTTAQRETLS